MRCKLCINLWRVQLHNFDVECFHLYNCTNDLRFVGIKLWFVVWCIMPVISAWYHVTNTPCHYAQSCPNECSSVKVYVAFTRTRYYSQCAHLLILMFFLCSFNCIFPSFPRNFFLHTIGLIDMQIVRKAVGSVDVDMGVVFPYDGYWKKHPDRNVWRST